jgi:hypothetical protein
MKIGSSVLILAVGLLLYCAEAESREAVFGDRTLELEETFFDDFTDGLNNWLIEGDGEVRQHHVFMEVDAREGSEGASTIWCKEKFEGPHVLEYDVRLMGNTVWTNINIFLMASMSEGPGIIETTSQRTGDYSEYHQFPNYLVTIINHNNPEEKRQMLRIRMRQNDGFHLIEECWREPLIIGKLNHIAYIIEPPRVDVYVNGERACDTIFPETLNEGLHGLRIYHTHSLYGNFHVSRIVEEK